MWVLSKYIYKEKKEKEEFTSLDTIPGVAEFILRRDTVRRYETVLCKLHNTSWYRNILQGTGSGKDGNPRVLVLYQEEWGSVDP